MNNPNPATIRQLLRELDEWYYLASLTAYEAVLQAAVMQVEQVFPGWTIAYAEIHTIGSQREAHGGMRHVLLPSPDLSPEPDEQSAPDTHPCTMVTLPAARPTAQRHEPRKRVVQDNGTSTLHSFCINRTSSRSASGLTFYNNYVSQMRTHKKICIY